MLRWASAQAGGARGQNPATCWRSGVDSARRTLARRAHPRLDHALRPDLEVEPARADPLPEWLSAPRAAARFERGSRPSPHGSCGLQTEVKSSKADFVKVAAA